METATEEASKEYLLVLEEVMHHTRPDLPRVIVGTGLSTQVVELSAELDKYLLGALRNRERRFKKSRITLPVHVERVEGLQDLKIWAQVRGNFTVVVLTAKDLGRPIFGLGCAKRSFDEARIERGVGIALARAADDVIIAMVRQAFLDAGINLEGRDGNGSGR